MRRIVALFTLLFVVTVLSAQIYPHKEIFLNRNYQDLKKRVLIMIESFEYEARIHDDTSFCLNHQFKKEQIYLEFTRKNESIKIFCSFTDGLCTSTHFVFSSFENLNLEYRTSVFYGRWRENVNGELVSIRNIIGRITKVDDGDYAVRVELKLAPVNRTEFKGLKKVKKKLIGTGAYMMN